MNRRPVLWITVEIGAAKIGDAVEQASDLAKRLDCNIQFNFNGVLLVARPGKTASELEAEYREASK